VTASADQVLISCEELADCIDNDGLVVVDCRFDLLAPHAGFHAYLSGHLPGARYAHLDRDLARRPGPGEGRHPLPAADVFARWLGRWGVERSTAVVVHDDSAGAIAARLWWMLRWLGHADCRILDGGLAAWRRQGYPLVAGLPEWAPRSYENPQPRADWVVSTAALQTQTPGRLVVDARARARFRGEKEPIDPVAGHVPGAVNLPFDSLLTAEGTFLDPATLARLFRDRLGRTDANEIVAMCGSGVTACHLLAGLRIAGLGDGRLYAGSWSEWIRDPARPIARGD